MRNTPTSEWPSRLSLPVPPGPSYDLREADLLAADPFDDVVPGPGELLQELVASTARDAVVYGLPGVLQHAAMRRSLAAHQDEGHPSGLGVWRHDRELAQPGYAAFRTPNVDTLYSSSWLDLSAGPWLVDIPAMGDRYYTVELLDAWSNAMNLSTRTLGAGGGRVWLATQDWHGDLSDGDLSDGARVVRVTTPAVWLLMRIFVRGADDLRTVHGLQDAVSLTPLKEPDVADEVVGPEPVDDLERASGRQVLQVVDHLVRTQGTPLQEQALVSRFRLVGVGHREPFDPDSWDAGTAAAVEEGGRQALTLVKAAIGRRGRNAGPSGWRTLSSGAYGFNYLHRAATNYVGLGATTRDESGPYTVLVDAEGQPLDGRTGPYRLRFTPPPVAGFWSLTAYDLPGGGLVPNSLGRYVLNALTEGLGLRDDGTVEVRAAVEPGPPGTTWLPVPRAPFYLVLRAYMGAPEIVDGTWVPCPVERVQ